MKDDVEAIEIPGKWEIPFLYSAGKTASRFFAELKARKKIMGTRCTGCKKVYMPPRSFCERCFEEIEEWVELAKTGTVEAFTIVMEKFAGFPDPPYIVAFVRIDGADTAVANFIEGVDLRNLKRAREEISIGMRVQTVFKEKREGRMTDFVFKPINYNA